MKRGAVALNLVPRTMKGEEYLKRISFGKLVPLPKEIEDRMADYKEPQSISCSIPNREHKVPYAFAYANGQELKHIECHSPIFAPGKQDPRMLANFIPVAV